MSADFTGTRVNRELNRVEILATVQNPEWGPTAALSFMMLGRDCTVQMSFYAPIGGDREIIRECIAIADSFRWAVGEEFIERQIPQPVQSAPPIPTRQSWPIAAILATCAGLSAVIWWLLVRRHTK